jgi:hypothetical protein
MKKSLKQKEKESRLIMQYLFNLEKMNPQQRKNEMLKLLTEGEKKQ